MSLATAMSDGPYTPQKSPGTHNDLDPHGLLEDTIGKESFNHVKELSPSKRIEALRTLAASWPVGENLTNLQAIICKMMEEERNRGYPLEPMQLTISPSEYDVLITDISEGDMHKIGEVLRVLHLSTASADPVFPVDGIMYGQNLRIFVPLVVKVRQTSINVNFLFDTGSPLSYLRKETFEA